MPRKKRITKRRVTPQVEHREPQVADKESKESLPVSGAQLMLTQMRAIPGITAKQKTEIAKRVEVGTDFTGIGLSEEHIKILEEIAGQYV